MEPAKTISGLLKIQILHLIHGFLKDMNLMKPCHEFERDYSIFFDLTYVKELISNGLWDDILHYLRGFTTPQSNDSSKKLFSEIIKQKYLEAIERSEFDLAKEILQNDLSVILSDDRGLFDALVSLQFYPDIKNHPKLRTWVDIPTSRNNLVNVVEEIVKANPDLRDKLVLPETDGRLVTLALQSKEIQFLECDCPRNVWSLLYDHQCPQRSSENPPADAEIVRPEDHVPAPTSSRRSARARASASVGAVSIRAPTIKLTPEGPSGGESSQHHKRKRAKTSASGLEANDSSSIRPEGTLARESPHPQPPTSIGKRGRGRPPISRPSTIAGTSSSRPPEVTSADGSLPDAQAPKRPRRTRAITPVSKPPEGSTAEANQHAQNSERALVLPSPLETLALASILVAGPTFPLPPHRPRSCRYEVAPVEQAEPSTSDPDLPCQVARTLSNNSETRSMDFHPIHQTMLLVGTAKGGLVLWDITAPKMLSDRGFDLWGSVETLPQIRAELTIEGQFPINQVRWSQDGEFAGVAYSKGLVQLFRLEGTELRNHVRIEAHSSNVNDISFLNLDGRLIFVTGGDDNMVKVWDATSGGPVRSFNGHEGPILCVHAYARASQNYILSTSQDGKLRVWLFDQAEAISELPVGRSASVQHTTDGERLLLGEVLRSDKSLITQRDEAEYSVMRSYLGLDKEACGKVHFHTARNQFLAVGHASQVKYWDLDDSSLRAATDADGGLETTAMIRFNANGHLLAATASHCQIKILASAEGMSLFTVPATGPRESTEAGETSEMPSTSRQVNLIDLNITTTLDDEEPNVVRKPSQLQ